MHGKQNDLHSKITLGGLFIALGIIYGDIGTSPLYVMKAIIGIHEINNDIILGGVSAVFWTLTLQSTIKYIFITLAADNNGEGGIFALYALVRRTKVKWLLIPAIIGGSALLADGIITPPMSVSSAVEGIRTLYPEIDTVPIIVAILICLFVIQQFGTKLVGKFFAPIMLIWFAMLGILGVLQITHNPHVIKAFNPYYAYHLLTVHPEGFYVLGFVFLCTTGAEALYSDMGHCGRKNIRISWIFVKSALMLNYFGQAAYLIKHEGNTLYSLGGKFANPFYLMMPEWFIPFGIIVATIAAVIASQALISGSFTLINEAIKLDFWPKVQVKYPTEERGQLYIPSINWLMMTGCVLIVLHFRESHKIEAAYGLAIVLCMIMTTILLNYYLIIKRVPWYIISASISIYMLIEGSFLIASLQKFMHGGYVAVFVSLILITVMMIWWKAKSISKYYTRFVNLNNYKKVLSELSIDQTIPKYATHLIYLTNSPRTVDIEEKIMYSILQIRPKRADIYWFIHFNIVDQPYKREYKVTEMLRDDLYRIDFYLGFREEMKTNLMFKEVIRNMAENGEVNITSRYLSLQNKSIVGDFKFVLSQKTLPYENTLRWFEIMILKSYFFLKKFSLSEEKSFGLDMSSVKTEKFPMIMNSSENISLNRIYKLNEMDAVAD